MGDRKRMVEQGIVEVQPPKKTGGVFARPFKMTSQDEAVTCY
ncbi:hypothetical protein [Acidithiobacillus sulfuriphilus]